MKIAILSDIHGNLEALEACCQRAWQQGVERFACLGDLVGYGADPVATLDLLFSLPGLISVLGNHDESIIVFGKEAVPSPFVRHTREWARQRLRPAHLEYLRSLPYVRAENGVTYVHASARHPHDWEYLRDTQQAEACLRAARTPLVFIGHGHVPTVFCRRADGVTNEIGVAESMPFFLAPGNAYVVNVGSVGQPRDGNSAACFVIYDEKARTITYHRVAYDHAAAAAKIRAAGFDPFFAERLSRGH
jgi:diadenosine tetraphosphatase ApaH/serine/threonine PP2A family protein phosphatase